MTQVKEPSSAVVCDEFDPELAKAIWNPVLAPGRSGRSWYFNCRNLKEGTKFTIDVQKWLGNEWFVEVSLETLDPTTLHERNPQPKDHLAQLRFRGICGFEYNQVQRYVQFNRRRSEWSQDEHYIRIFDTGYVFAYV